MSKLMFRGEGEVRGIFKKTDKQTIQVILIKKTKIRGNFCLFFAVKQTLSLARNNIQSLIRGYAVVQYFLTISPKFVFKTVLSRLRSCYQGLNKMVPGCTRLLLYFNTNKPYSFFLQNTSCIRKPQVNSGGGGVRTPCTFPLDPPLLFKKCNENVSSHQSLKV